MIAKKPVGVGRLSLGSMEHDYRIIISLKVTMSHYLKIDDSNQSTMIIL